MNNHISVKKDLPDVNWMVATNLVVRHTLVFARVLFVEKFVINHFSQRSKIKMCEAVFLSNIFGGLILSDILLGVRFRVWLSFRLLVGLFAHPVSFLPFSFS